LIVEAHSTRGHRLEDISYVELWAACDTYMKIRNAELNELLDKLESPIAR
jgi:hypothetical protein